jgi:transposase
MDNLGSHKANAVRRAIRAAGARLFYLPKYSPDLNPIEQFFAKFKHWLRKSRTANHRGRLRCHRSDPQHRLTGRMRQLLRQRRI